MEWLVDDFLVDPTSPLFQDDVTINKRQPAQTTIEIEDNTIPAQPAPALAEDEEEELIHITHPIIPTRVPLQQTTKCSAPGRLKRSAYATPPGSGNSSMHGKLCRATRRLDHQNYDDVSEGIAEGKCASSPLLPCHDLISNCTMETGAIPDLTMGAMRELLIPNSALKSNSMMASNPGEKIEANFLTSHKEFAAGESEESNTNVSDFVQSNNSLVREQLERTAAAGARFTRDAHPPAAPLKISGSSSSTDTPKCVQSPNSSPGCLEMCETATMSPRRLIPRPLEVNSIANADEDVHDQLNSPQSFGMYGSTSGSLSTRGGLTISATAQTQGVSVMADADDQLVSDYLQQMLTHPLPGSSPPVVTRLPAPGTSDIQESFEVQQVQSILSSWSVSSVLNHSPAQDTTPYSIPLDSRETGLLAGLVNDATSIESGFTSLGQAQGLINKGNVDDHAPTIPHHVEIWSNCEPREVTASWISSGRAFESQMNKRGIFHVRVLRAQRLSCPVGSQVHAIVSLNPWKGKVRTENATAFSHSSSQRGVCVQWSDDVASIPVIHAYSSSDSPVPTLQVDIVFNPLGLFDVNLCSIEAACHGLLCIPFEPVLQWFSPNGLDDGQSAMVEIEAMFEPAAEDIDDKEGIDVSFLNDPPMSSRQALNVDENSHSEVSMSLQSTSRVDPRAFARPHLLRTLSHWKPATCCVCNRNITRGFRGRSAYRCEVCAIDCCSDCQVQVDAKLPCCSDAAEQARNKAIQNRLTVESILNTVAPVDGPDSSLQSGSEHSRGERAKMLAAALGDSTDTGRGIGTVTFSIIRACILENPVEPHADAMLLTEQSLRLRHGDYYVRVASSDNLRTKRTQTVQSTSRPKFANNEISFNVTHYGSEFLVELIDATNDKPIGKTLITTQCLLQLHRDALVEQSISSYFSLLLGQAKYESLHLKLALRSGVKRGFGYDFFVESKSAATATAELLSPGAITGIVELHAIMEEDKSSLYGREPYICPRRPAQQFDMAALQLHLKRMTNIVKDVKRGIDGYKYVVSWRNPFLTSFSLVVYIRFWSTFDLAYIGSLPFFMLCITMIFLAFARKLGRLKRTILNRAMDANEKSAKTTANYSLHRPAGLLRVAVKEGKNFRSELGLAGKVACAVFWDPSRFVDDKEKEMRGLVDASAVTQHEIASTTFQYGFSPKWENLIESALSKRLKLLIPNQTGDEFFQYESDQSYAAFPVLQPFSRINDDSVVLQPWHTAGAAVVFELRFIDSVSLLPGSSFVSGYVIIPFSRLLEQQRIAGWFDVATVDSRQHDATGEVPQIFLSIKWDGPVSDPALASEIEKESAIVVQEEYLRSSLANNDKRLGLLGNSVGAFNTMLGLSDQLAMVQNILAVVLDFIGALRNMFNFADPNKSAMVFLAAVVAWSFFAVVPTRQLVMIGGVFQYAFTFWTRFGHLFSGSQVLIKPKVLPNNDQSTGCAPSRYGTWLRNAFLGLPTDEDIRKTYFWDTRRNQEELHAIRTTEKRTARLKRLWRAQWYSQVLILRIANDGTGEKRSGFAIIQGRRFIWWSSVEDFDNGEEYSGHVNLTGHAGLATPSPVEMRFLDQEDFCRVVCIFGHQEKVTVVAPSESVKDKLELAVHFATSCKQD
ncbi:hypothetical protein MPSEU_000376800 [Mayamaea pseudoterrestris]|nr:hypothetical protein MPSEU_000376800 [Mayamaea pseudoterrestris]